MDKNTETELINNESYEKNISNLEILLKDIRKQYEQRAQDLKLKDSSYLLERIVSAEKDLKALSDKFEELKKSIEENKDLISKLNVSYQEVSGSVNQLKLIIDEFKESHKQEKENKINFIWQLIVPIILAIIFFLSGLFLKSCSSIHEQNLKPINKSNNNSYEYKNFESLHYK